MPRPGGREKAIRWRGKVYVGEEHKDAIELAFEHLPRYSAARIKMYERVLAGKEEVVFGYAKPDGSDFITDGASQEARVSMYFGYL